jgi:hypothetical protein
MKCRVIYRFKKTKCIVLFVSAYSSIKAAKKFGKKKLKPYKPKSVIAN